MMSRNIEREWIEWLRKSVEVLGEKNWDKLIIKKSIELKKGN